MNRPHAAARISALRRLAAGGHVDDVSVDVSDARVAGLDREADALAAAAAAYEASGQHPARAAAQGAAIRELVRAAARALEETQ